MKEAAASPTPSVYASLRRHRPDLEPRPLRKPMLLALTRAIEDESLSRADRPLLFASFQNERFYRQEQARWRELARERAPSSPSRSRTSTDCGRRVTVQPRCRSSATTRWPANGPSSAAPTIMRSAWRRGSRRGRWRAADEDRVFETIWSVEPPVVWDAARVSAGIATAKRAGLIDRVRSRLEIDPGRPAEEQLRLAAAITNRTLSYLS